MPSSNIYHKDHKVNLNEYQVVTGFSNYLINKNGEIYSLISKRLLKPDITRLGYWNRKLKSDLTGKIVSVGTHRLVLLSFKGVDSNPLRTEINHIDGNPSNNSLSNLEWCTHQENMQHCYKVLGFRGSNFGKFGRQSNSGVALWGINLQTGEFLEFGSALEAARSNLRFINSKISACIRGDRNQHAGFIWFSDTYKSKGLNVG